MDQHVPGTERGERARERIVEALRAFTAEQGRPPTIRELAAGTGLTRGSIEHHLRVLVERGVIKRDGGSRSIFLVTEP